jgi:hypothetical protein
MAGHQAIGIYLQPFFFLTKLYALYPYVFILFSDKHINPINRGIGNKVQAVIISEFVFATHFTKLVFSGN